MEQIRQSRLMKLLLLMQIRQQMPPTAPKSESNLHTQILQKMQHTQITQMLQIKVKQMLLSLQKLTQQFHLKLSIQFKNQMLLIQMFLSVFLLNLLHFQPNHYQTFLANCKLLSIMELDVYNAMLLTIFLILLKKLVLNVLISPFLMSKRTNAKSLITTSLLLRLHQNW